MATLRRWPVSEPALCSYTLYFVGGLLVVGAASYLLFTNKEKVVRTLTGDKEESDPVPEQEPTPKKENFKSVFDD